MEISIDDARKCSICLDSFRCPKMLPCKHTFCKRCISGYQRKYKSDDEFQCPLCRTVLVLPENGVAGFWDNYFIRDIFPERVCEVCNAEEDDVDDCDYCDKYLCSFCAPEHVCKRPRKEIKRQREDPSFRSYLDSNSDWDSSSVSESNSLSSDSNDEPIPFELRKHGPTTIVKTVSMEICIQISEEECISSIFQVSEDVSAFLTFGGFICRFFDTRDGLTLSEISIVDGATDVCGSGDGTIFSLLRNCSLVMKTTGNGADVSVISIKDCDPLKMCSIQQDRILVLGMGNRSTIVGQILDNGGKELDKFNLNVEFYPHSLAVNDSCSVMCILYAEINFVDIRGMDGHLIKRYSGCTLEQIEEEFKPLSVTSFADDSFLVLNGSTKSLHIISPTGDFMGLVICENCDKPCSIYRDNANKIWIGDSEDGTLKAFAVDTYCNVFPGPENNIERLKLRKDRYQRPSYLHRTPSLLRFRRRHEPFLGFSRRSGDSSEGEEFPFI
ncbi:uncharacterized protein LOC133179036 [Saccostrea echinata]|uniref:uncharacterized protein LOC133179036 n=1 Tax=Saccostrea echinata TaxID=191078 RepID=UPI002A82FB8C|nr:uncharacterized protein LOC133179036 [Saccostrea echinata]